MPLLFVTLMLIPSQTFNSPYTKSINLSVKERLVSYW